MSNFKPLIEEAKTDEDILACHETIVELRPHRQDPQDYLQRVRRMQEKYGYHLMFVRDESGNPVSILGYRITETLFHGPHLYVDDVVTLSRARRRGFADIL